MGSSASIHPSREKPALNESVIQNEQRMANMEISVLAVLGLPAPPASPPTKSKSEICKSSQLDALDNAVVQQVASELVRLSAHALASRLVSLADRNDDVARLRSLFTWLVSIDIDQLVNEAGSGNETPPQFSVLSYLHKIQRRQGNYANLMAALCNCAGIPVRIVAGVTKSASYRLGKPMDRAASAAQWNAVHVAGEWRLLDCRWASASRAQVRDGSNDWQLMSVDGRRARLVVAAAAKQRVRRPINDFFFLPEPTELGATHFPNEPAWQLVAEPLAWIDFERGAYVRERFFQLGARFGRSELSRSCTLPLGADTATAVVELIIDAADSPSVTFKYVLSRARADLAADAAVGTAGEGGGDIRRCVYFEHDGRTIRYTVQLPARGEYKFDVYGRDERSHHAHELMCSYLLTNECADSAAEPPQQQQQQQLLLLPLPDEPEIGWGPGATCDAYGIVAVSHRVGRIDIPDASSGELDVVFALPQHPLELRHVLLTGGEGDEVSPTAAAAAAAAAQSILVVHGGLATASLRIARPGAYALKLFAGEERVPAELQNVCNYLITRRAPRPPPPSATSVVAVGFPLLVDGHLGLTSYARELRVEPALPERHPIIVVADGDDDCVDLEFVYDGAPPLELLTLASEAPPAAAAITGSSRGLCAARPTSGNRGVVLHVDTTGASETLVRVFARIADDPLRVYNVYNCLVRSLRGAAAASVEATRGGGGSGSASSAAIDEAVRASVVLSGSLASVALPPDYAAPVVELKRPHRYLPPAAHQVALAAAPDESARGGVVLTLRLVDSGKYDATVFATESDGSSGRCRLSVVARLSITSPGLDDGDDRDNNDGGGCLAEDAAATPGDDDTKHDEEELLTVDADEDEAAFQTAERSAEADEDAAKAAAHATKLATRRALRDALTDRHLAEIQSTLADYLACGGDPAEKLVKAARRVETILLAADALQVAIGANSVKLLHDALTQARAANSRGELTVAMKVAERKLAQLQIAEHLSNTVVNLDLRAMSEMRAYAHPPEAVFLVAKATLLLLGTDSADIQDWRQVQAWLGKTGAESVKRRVVMFSHRTAPLERTILPKRIYERFTPADVRAVSAGASAFYTWGSGMISLIEQVAAELQEKKIAAAAADASATSSA